MRSRRPRCPESAAAVPATRPSSAPPPTPRRSVGSRSLEATFARGSGRPAPPPWLHARASDAEPVWPRRRFPAAPAPRDGRAAGHASVSPSLAGLPVRRVAAAPAAVFAQLDAVRRVPLGLGRLVVPPLAIGASEGDCVSYSGCQAKSSWLRAWK